jgi:hypothetical protein
MGMYSKVCEIIVKDKNEVVELLYILDKTRRRHGWTVLTESTVEGEEIIGTYVNEIIYDCNYIKFKTCSDDYDLVLDYLSFRGIDYCFRCIEFDGDSGEKYGSVYDETGEFFQIGYDAEEEIDFKEAEDWYCQYIDEAYIENALK